MGVRCGRGRGTMSSGWRLDWRGSSGSLWSRGRDCGGTDGLDLLNGARHVPPPGTSVREGGRSRRKGLRKRFLSLTEGLASFLTGDKKEKEPVKHANFRHFNHSTDLDGDLTNSGYCSDYSSECRTDHQRKDSNTSIISLKDVTPRAPVWTSTVSGPSSGQVVGPGATKGLSSPCSKSQGSVKAPPSPPPRRFSLWAMDVRYDHFYFPDPLRPTAPVSYVPSMSTSPPPPPPIRYYNLAPPKSPLLSRHNSPRPQPPSPSMPSLGAPKRPSTPPSPRSHSPFRSCTPPTSRVSTPLGSPVLRGRSLSDSRTESSRAGSEARGRESRAAWYRRKSQARRRAHSR